MPIQLPEKVYQDLNRNLRELEDMKKDLENAMKAGVPNLDDLKERLFIACEQCQKFKEVYFPNRP